MTNPCNPHFWISTSEVTEKCALCKEVRFIERIRKGTKMTNQEFKKYQQGFIIDMIYYAIFGYIIWIIAGLIGI